jgi:hypothetical protein
MVTDDVGEDEGDCQEGEVQVNGVVEQLGFDRGEFEDDIPHQEDNKEVLQRQGLLCSQLDISDAFTIHNSVQILKEEVDKPEGSKGNDYLIDIYVVDDYLEYIWVDGSSEE